MQIIKPDTKINFVEKIRIALIMSSIVIAAGLIYMSIYGLNYGIEFKGGTEVRVKFNKSIKISKLRNSVAKLGYLSPTVQTVGSSGNEYLIYVNKAVSDTQSKGIAYKIVKNIKKVFPGTNIDLRSVNVIGPKFGKTLRDEAILAIIVATIAILFYVSIRFKVRFAIGAIIALIHDVLVTLAFVAIFHFQFTLQILAAILTIIGYSLNDTIVIFDRIREKLKMTRGKLPLNQIINTGINETLSRTLLTSLTTLFVLIVLFFFGGSVIHGFSFALIVGIISGTYSSIYIASPILLMFKQPLYIEEKGNINKPPDIAIESVTFDTHSDEKKKINRKKQNRSSSSKKKIKYRV